MSVLARLEAAHVVALQREREARRDLVAGLAQQVVATWWARHTEAPQLVDALGIRWVIRSSRTTPGRTLTELELVRPVAHVRLRGESHPLHPRRRLTTHHASVLEESRRTCTELPPALPPADDRRAVDWARLAANDLRED